MSIDRFLEPRLTGARFEGHAIPLEFLKDLAVLEEMIVEVAKAEFLKENADRKRSPRGFTEGVEFKLTGIEDGSARPVISLVIAGAAGLFAPSSQTYLERARDSVVNVIAAAEQNQPIKDYLPEKTLGYFDRIGRSLREGEAIEFGRGAQEAPARLTRETRRRLVLASSIVTELTEETFVRGSIPEADQDNMTFELQLLDGRKIKAPIDPQHRDTIIEAFAGYKTGTRILLQGIGRFSRSEKLVGLDSVEHVNILDPLDVAARVDELRLLKNGWLEGGGKAPAPELLDWLIAAFIKGYPDELSLPYLYPTEDGGVRLEWPIARNEISLDIDPQTYRGQWHLLNLDTDAEETRELNLDDAAQWEWIAQRIQEKAGAAA
jgi:hypothetical protein